MDMTYPVIVLLSVITVVTLIGIPSYLHYRRIERRLDRFFEDPKNH